MIVRLHAGVRAFCAVAAIVGGLMTTRVTRERVPAVTRDAPARDPTSPAPEALSSVVSRVTETNPFRPGHRAPPQRYSLEIANAPPPPEPPPPPPAPERPEWTLTGILWGPSPVAVFEGVPGTEGATLTVVGDSVGPIRVESITADSVVVLQADSAWTFRLATPWKGEER